MIKKKTLYTLPKKAISGLENPPGLWGSGGWEEKVCEA